MFEDKFPEQFYKKTGKGLTKRFWIVSTTAVLLLSVLFSSNQLIKVTQELYPEKAIGEVLGSFGQFFISGDRQLNGEQEGVVNILLLGVGGNGYYGSIITDTIVIVSIKPESAANPKTKVSLLSIPRDFKVQLPDSDISRKINESYMRGELRSSGRGQDWIKEIVRQWTGIEIHYYAVIDFEGFKTGIDAVGGVDVMVDRSFIDYSFPNDSAGFLPEVKFEQGPAHLDGERALQFARSRHGNSGEGSDFARIKRQQKILESFRDKLNQLNLIENLAALYELRGKIEGHFRTDLELWQIKRAYELVRNVPEQDIYTHSLDPKTGLTCSEIDAETQLYFLRLCEGVERQDIMDWANKRFE